jgi:hypothetical protein
MKTLQKLYLVRIYLAKDYIHNNPVKASIVAIPQDYLNSSAMNYVEMDRVIGIIKADRRWKTI